MLFVVAFRLPLFVSLFICSFVVHSCCCCSSRCCYLLTVPGCDWLRSFVERLECRCVSLRFVPRTLVAVFTHSVQRCLFPGVRFDFTRCYVAICSFRLLPAGAVVAVPLCCPFVVYVLRSRSLLVWFRSLPRYVAFVVRCCRCSFFRRCAFTFVCGWTRSFSFAFTLFVTLVSLFRVRLVRVWLFVITRCFRFVSFLPFVSLHVCLFVDLDVCSTFVGRSFVPSLFRSRCWFRFLVRLFTVAFVRFMFVIVVGPGTCVCLRSFLYVDSVRFSPLRVDGWLRWTRF